MFDIGAVRILYWRELRSALRERNIVINSILLPIFLYPLLLWMVYSGISFVSGLTEGFASRVMLKGLPQEHVVLKTELGRDIRFELKNFGDPVGEVRKGNLDALVEFSPLAGAVSLKGNFQVLITCDNSRDRSVIARIRTTENIGRYRDYALSKEAKAIGLAPEQLQQFWVESHNLATGREMGQFILGLMLPMFLIIMLSVGCMYPAIDTTAGEREKSTWETLMTVATSRSNIMLAKYLYVATMAALAGVLNLAAMVFSMKAVMAPLLGGRGEGFTFQIPMKSVPLILAVTILLALFITAGMMILASFARTFKEGQSLVSPFYLATLIPVMFLQVPGLEFSLPLAFIPIVNVAMVFREAIAGTFHWRLIGITLGVELACIVLALWLASAILKHEDFLIGSYGGHFGKFMKERLLASWRPKEKRA